jgi:hypothetical protein
VYCHLCEWPGATQARLHQDRGKRAGFRERLGEVIAGVGVLVQAIKKVKADRKRWHEEYEAEQKRRQEEAELEREFARKGDLILKAAQALHQSQLVDDSVPIEALALFDNSSSLSTLQGHSSLQI